MTEDVFSFLGPLTSTLCAKSIAQVVVLRDEPEFRHLLAKFDRTVRLVLLPAESGVIGRLRDMARALRREASAPTVVYCHLHGVIPSVVAAWASSARQINARLLFSPHGSRSLGPFKVLGTAMLTLLKAAMPQDSLVPVANNGMDARKVSKLSRSAVSLIESPVHEVFFNLTRREHQSPRVIAGAGLPDRVAAARFAQMAVLFWDEVVTVEFAWYGPVDAESRARLKAAGVSVHDALGEQDRAVGMSSAWVYLSLGNSEGFPSLLAEAMAVGLPCLGWGSSIHRDFISHEITGLIADDEVGALASLALLIRSTALREGLGASVRRDAILRFDRSRFDQAILDVYARAPISS